MLAPDRRKALTVSAKHRMTEPPEHGRISSHPSARRGLSGVAAACEIVCTSMLGAAALIVLLVSVEPEKPTVVAAQQPPRASQPVRQEGTVVAVTGNPKYNSDIGFHCQRQGRHHRHNPGRHGAGYRCG